MTRKCYQFAAQIARFAADAGMTVPDVCELHRLVVRAFKAGERDANDGGDRFDKPAARVKEMATRHGLKVQWPGLYPVFTLPNGQEVMLPGA